MERVSRYFILFMEMSFWGWAVETVFFLLCYGQLYDRGFMTLPFCTIYGCSFLLLYFLVGIPDEGEGQAALPGRRKQRQAGLYCVICAVVPTALELVTGIFFHRVFGIRLWSYSAYRFHLGGYICLEYTLLWGLLVPVCMKYVFLPIKRRVFDIPRRWAGGLAGLLALLAVWDWAANFSRQKVVLPRFPG